MYETNAFVTITADTNHPRVYKDNSDKPCLLLRNAQESDVAHVRLVQIIISRRHSKQWNLTQAKT